MILKKYSLIMLNLDENLNKVIILFADGFGNLCMPLSDLKKPYKKLDAFGIKERVEKYLFSLMQLKNSIAIELLREVE
jgi:hypothetical protein